LPSRTFVAALPVALLAALSVAPSAGSAPVASHALAASNPGAASPKHRPAGMPLSPALPLQRQLAATFAADRVIVAARQHPAADEYLRRSGAKLLSRRAGIWMVDGRIAGRVAFGLEARGLLRYIERDRGRIRHSFYGDGEPLAPDQWWVPAVGADQLQPPGPGVPIVVIDDGLDLTHPEFAGRPETALLNSNVLGEGDGHGTMVASVAAASLNGQGLAGLYPQARLRSYDYGTGSCSEVVAGTDAAIEADQFSVINFSGGFARASDCFALYDVIAAAFGTGHLVVAAAGNDGETRENFPASYPHVITVAATDANDDTSGFSTRSLGIDLAAPGESIPAAVPFQLDPTGYASVDGTSFSAPLVSAAAAWIWTTRASEIDHVTQLFELVRTSARDVREPGWDKESGFGVLSLPALTTAVMPPADSSEPNDDIDQVVANGLFREATPPLLHPGKARAQIRASLDWTEDPVDVYRVWIPARGSVSFRLTADANVDLELFRPSARTVYYENRRAALRAPLMGGSYRSGRSAESFVVSNSGRRGAYAFACAYKAGDGAFLDATYQLRVAVRR
jgi:subtilisin family serine protease